MCLKITDIWERLCFRSKWDNKVQSHFKDAVVKWYAIPLTFTHRLYSEEKTSDTGLWLCITRLFMYSYMTPIPFKIPEIDHSQISQFDNYPLHFIFIHLVCRESSIAFSKDSSRERSDLVLRLSNSILSLTSPSSCLSLLPHFLFRSGFPSMACFKRQYLRNIWAI
jgi:hypothetical protein